MSTNAKIGASRKYHHGDLRQALIDAGVAIVTEEQNWDFSLREVARRAGVSHNAPYNHFDDKTDLLEAVAAVGFDSLRDDMNLAMTNAADAQIALIAISQAYVVFAANNPAIYRLMFGPDLARPSGSRPELAETSGAAAKSVLRNVIVRGAKEELFAVETNDEASIAMAVLAVWSAVHGLAMLMVDGKSGRGDQPEKLIGGVMRHFLKGLKRH